MNEKLTTLAHLRMTAQKSRACSAQVAAAAAEAIEELERTKQARLTGREGQVVGFDAAGNAVACTTNGMIGYMFRVSEEGDLLLHYVEENAPNFYVGQDGNLYLNFKEEGN